MVVNTDYIEAASYSPSIVSL